MSEDMCPICDGKMLHQEDKKFCPCQFLPPVRRGFLPAYGCDMRRRHRWGPDEIRHDRRALGFEDDAKESEDMTDVREQLTEAYQDGWLLAATRELHRLAREEIIAQDAKIEELKTLIKDLVNCPHDDGVVQAIAQIRSGDEGS